MTKPINNKRKRSSTPERQYKLVVGVTCVSQINTAPLEHPKILNGFVLWQQAHNQAKTVRWKRLELGITPQYTTSQFWAYIWELLADDFQSGWTAYAKSKALKPSLMPAASVPTADAFSDGASRRFPTVEGDLRLRVLKVARLLFEGFSGNGLVCVFKQWEKEQNVGSAPLLLRFLEPDTPGKASARVKEKDSKLRGLPAPDTSARGPSRASHARSRSASTTADIDDLVSYNPYVRLLFCTDYCLATVRSSSRRYCEVLLAGRSTSLRHRPSKSRLVVSL
jgi:hypothetical protein